MKPTQALRQLPDFCWMTLSEVVAYAEQLCEELEYHKVAGLLKHLKNLGVIETKEIIREWPSRGRVKIKMYKRVSQATPSAKSVPAKIVASE